MERKKRIVLLGATGSIGRSTLRILRAQPHDFQLIGISYHRNWQLAREIVEEFSPKFAATENPDNPKLGTARAISSEELAALEEADLVVVAQSGLSSLRPLLAAIAAGKTIALANKESVVAAGHLLQREVLKTGAKILPVDSEHSGIFQCLSGHIGGVFQGAPEVQKIWLTASGGPFWESDLRRMQTVTATEAIHHPTWSMGKKISVDSATMANKGLEKMEAQWFYGLTAGQIEVVVHRRSIVHALVEFCDGTALAAMHPPSMEFPIANCLNHPRRCPVVRPSLDFSKISSLDFAPPDRGKFPCLALAERAIASGKSAPCDYNAANEAAVTAFLENRLAFLKIPKVIGRVLGKMDAVELPSVDAMEARHREVVCRAEEWIGEGKL